MRALVQRVKNTSVTIDNEVFSSIDNGLLVFLGIEDTDDENDIAWLAAKISRLRIFSDENGAMNLSVHDVDGDCLVVSQFTLHASTKDRKSTRLNSTHVRISYAVFCLKKKKTNKQD